MGVVWRAKDRLLDRDVAVKQLRWPDLTADEVEVARARAMREARNAARLQHPDAISVFDVVVEDDRPWLVMEYLPSRSLAGLVAQRGGLSPDEAARIGARVAAALAAAHAAGIVHRDVKPSNVLIGHDGKVKLTDFGISRAAGDGTLTANGMITGTPAYLAPEVARGEQPSQASDVFSLGATLYAAIEGKSPHGVSDNSFGLLYRAAAGLIEPPARSGALTGVLTRLLAAEPAERPTAAEAVELLADLGSQVTPDPPVADEPGGQEPGGQGPGGQGPGGQGPEPRVEARSTEGGGEGGGGAKRKRWLAPVVAAVVLLVVAGAVAVAALQPWRFGAGTSTAPNAADAAADAEAAAGLVRRHYDLLPENTSAAYENLAVSFRQPFEEYQRFWSQYDDVRTDQFEAVQDHPTRFLVRVRVTFVRRPSEVAGLYQLVVEQVDGRLQISSSEQLG
ncbi:serine/threonine protein kinase [Saccharothrix sp. S26]|nr:serine/threonine protein kinase [Saccharothrix sp. S26]